MKHQLNENAYSTSSKTSTPGWTPSAPRKVGRPKTGKVYFARTFVKPETRDALLLACRGLGSKRIPLGKILDEWASLAKNRDGVVAALRAAEGRVEAAERAAIAQASADRATIKRQAILLAQGGIRRASRRKPRREPQAQRLVACELACGFYLDPIRLAAGRTVCVDCEAGSINALPSKEAQV